MSLMPRRETPDFKRPEEKHAKQTLGTIYYKCRHVTQNLLQLYVRE